MGGGGFNGRKITYAPADRPDEDRICGITKKERPALAPAVVVARRMAVAWARRTVGGRGLSFAILKQIE